MLPLLLATPSRLVRPPVLVVTKRAFQSHRHGYTAALCRTCTRTRRFVTNLWENRTEARPEYLAVLPGGLWPCSLEPATGTPRCMYGYNIDNCAEYTGLEQWERYSNC